jgi:phage terminase large subunit-like protein
MLAEIVLACLGKHPTRTFHTPIRAWVASDSHQKNRDSVWPLLEKLIPKKDYHPVYGSRREILRNVFSNGSELSLKSYEAEREAFQGPEIQAIGLDERSPEDIFTECEMRGSTCNGLLIMTTTPADGIGWDYRRLYLPSKDKARAKAMGLAAYKLNSLDAWWVPKEEKLRLRASLNEEEYRIRVLGEYVHRQGLVYKDFSENVHVMRSHKPPDGARVYEIYDPGTRTFAVGLFYVATTGVCVLFDEIYESEKSIPFIAEMVNQKREFWGYKRPARELIDPASDQHQPGMILSVREQLDEFGIHAQRANNDEAAGIMRVRDYLVFEKDQHGLPIPGGGPMFFVTDNCKNAIYEFQNHCYDKTDPEKEDDRTQKKLDHLLDCSRYFVLDLPMPARVLVDTGWDKSIGNLVQLSQERVLNRPAKRFRRDAVRLHRPGRTQGISMRAQEGI